MNNESVVTSFTVYLVDGADSDDASDGISDFGAMFSYEDDTYEITTMSSVEDTMDSMLSMMSALLAGIASIALWSAASGS
jgi:ABC-type antimicrobial peptide transport system permease subunit